MSGSAPNFPAQMAAVFVDSKLTPLLILGLLLFGLIGLGFTPREENPQIIVPAAELSVEMPGAFPEEVEHRLLKPLETQLLAISGVKNVYGMALDGRALIQVEFEVGQDAERALVRLYDRVFRFVLPPGANPIRVRAIDVDDVPVFTLTLSSGQYDDYELRRMADRVAEQLRSVADVGEITVVGGQTREFRLETDPERLYTYGISLNLLADAVRGADLSIPVENRVGPDGRNTALRIESGLYTRESLESTIVAARDGRLVRVSDLADVVDGPPPERQRMTRFAYGPASSGASTGSPREVAAVTIAVAKRQGVNAVSLTKSLRDRVSAMADDFLPPGVDLVITRDDGVKADRTVTTLVEHLFIAIGAVMLV
ncbi:MAG: efflux RND transporter permease subunit, partial [Gammaproteobacteria bacterium]